MQWLDAIFIISKIPSKRRGLSRLAVILPYIHKFSYFPCLPIFDYARPHAFKPFLFRFFGFTLP